ncbi:MAG: carotenoid oxygenase family protein [Pseudomonadota bacterium]
MQRREFLKSSLAAGIAAATPLWSSPAAATNSWKAEFAAAQKANPWLAAYAHADQPSYAATAKISGTWPEALSGTLYRNGPAGHEVGGYRYHHWFDGDGLMQAYRISSEGVTHQARFIDTYKRQAEQKAGRPLYGTFASDIPDPAPVTSPDTVNPGNISVLHHHGKLMALWEAGSPWEIDEQNLHTHGVYSFSDHTTGVPFSAHPRVEPDGTLWNFGYLSSANILVLWHIDAKGKLQKIEKIDAAPITMVHDFVVTQKHIVLLIAPFHYDNPEASNFLAAHTWHADAPTRVLVVDKDDFSKTQWFELPAQWVFHFGNAWEDEAGVIRFDAARAETPLVMIENFSAIMRGKVSPPTSSLHHQYRIDTKRGSIVEVPLFSPTVESEFPCVDPRVSCRRNNKLFMLSHDSARPAPHTSLNEVSSFDYESGRMDTYRYPDTQIPEEHLYVAAHDAAPEQGGWVIGSALDWQNKQMLLNAFDARRISDGPIASATLPYALPLGLHGKFVHG